jgi:hypothetical protein
VMAASRQGMLAISRNQEVKRGLACMARIMPPPLPCGCDGL